jgi:glycosyltransferase involved in cell wall biosynthesis
MVHAQETRLSSTGCVRSPFDMRSPDERRMVDVKALLVSHGSSYEGGGGEFVFTEAVAALRAADAQVIAVYPAPGALVEDALRLGAETHVMSVPRWADWLSRSGVRAQARWTARHVVAASAAFRFLRRERPDVVVTNTITPPSFALAARLAGVRHVWMIHEFGKGGSSFQFLLGYARTVRLISSLSETVICCSKAVEGSLLEVAPDMHTRVVYNGIESPTLPVRPRHEGPLRAALIGRFSEQKGQRVAVEAVQIARRRGADVTLTLVGGGDSSQVEELAAKLGIGQHVAFLPVTEHPIEVWREADVALTCSRHEGFGRVTFEAMRAGLPVCGADSGGTREIVTDGVDGFLCPPGDAAFLASKLVRLSQDEKLRQSLGGRAVKRGLTFTTERFRRELQNEVLRVGVSNE